jgi:predicted aspartyl protease
VNPAALAVILAAAQLAAGTPSPTIPPAVVDNSLEVTGESVAAKLVETRMVVAVKVNDQGPFSFVVDSGADGSVIGAALARRLGLPPGPPVTLNGMAGATRVETVRLEHLTIGTSAIPDIVAPALPEQYIGAQGLIGIDALIEQRLMLDFERKTITVQDARTKPPQAEEGEIVVTARRRKGQLILTEVTVADRAIYAVIDTGAQVTIGNSALLSRVMRSGGALREGRRVTLISVTGQEVQANEYIMPDVRVGGMVLRGMPVAFVDVPPFALFGLDKQPALLLGTDVLRSFRRVSLDFRNRRVRFTQPR